MFTYTRMPFGVATGPGHFQFVMNQILRDLNLRVCVIYLDDVTIFANTKQECWAATI